MPSTIITRDDLKTWLDERREFVLIDTSLPEDFAVAHLPSARGACVFEVTFLDQVDALPRPAGSKPPRESAIIVYGTSEQSLASRTAAEKLVAAGFSQVFDFRGGLADWRAAGLAVEGSGSASELSPLEERSYAIDLEQSRLEWIGRSLGNKHYGTLDLLAGSSITLQGGGAIVGNFSIDMASIDDLDLTDSTMKKVLHHHPASDDFFDVARYPQASFQLEHAEPIPNASPSDPNYVLHGRFTLKGIENPLSFEALIGRSPTGDRSLVARANFDLDRTKWNVLYGSGKFYEKLGKHLVNDLITVDLKIVAR